MKGPVYCVMRESTTAAPLSLFRYEHPHTVQDNQIHNQCGFRSHYMCRGFSSGLPNVGGVARARAFEMKVSDAPLAIVDKRHHRHNVA
ncbi:hypothetical protein M8C21_001657, partial [Ambrosia artemisiifolia]